MAKRPRPSTSETLSPGLFPELDLSAPTKPDKATAPNRGARNAKKRATKSAAPADDRPQTAGSFAQVVLNRPVRRTFTYTVPTELAGSLQRGVRVAVPFGARRIVGVVVDVVTETDVPRKRLRNVSKVLDTEPLIGEELLELTRWIAEEYACSWGEALHAVLPAALKRERGPGRVIWACAVEGVGATELAEIAESQPKQHRLLRTLIELQGPTELRDLLRRLNLSDSPAKTLAKRGWIELVRGQQSADPLDFARSATGQAKRLRPEQLSPEQQQAVDAIAKAQDASGSDAGSGAFLLEGVTGSGKTEVYLRAIERAQAQGRGAIVLVPEIALTPQTVGWFRSRFDNVAVLHSRMTDAQRLDMWTRTASGELQVVVGARSAVFAPVRNLGVIVVDEEHEPSFKQGSTPRYHAREVALRRAQQSSAVCVLGSATPALETWERANRGELQRLRLTTRVGGRPLPEVEVIDMRQEQYEIGRDGLFSRRLCHLIEGALERGEQAILFLNRRGFAPVLWCPGCKETLKCKTCDVSLTFHRRIARAVCHACCEESQAPRSCPTCSFPGLKYLGAGSEKIDQALRERFPKARVARMDSDTMRRRQDYEERLTAFGNGEIDLLVGTQMIAKGLDFPGVTVVGIVQADAALHLPEFRASERTFQLVAQVSGRAGRGELEGRIIVQTTSPEHPAIQRAAAHDYQGFAETESALRGELGYPPHGRLIRLLFDDTDLERVRVAAATVAESLRAALADWAPKGAMVLGPAPAPFAQLRGRHRHHLLIKLPPGPEAMAHTRSAALEATADLGGRPRVAIDVDPADLL